MPLISITGTPGTGKTSVSGELRSRGYNVVDLSSYIRERGLLGEKDEARDTYEVDLESLNESLSDLTHVDGTVFMEGHLSHLLDSHLIIVLRCSPAVLAKRLRSRGYSESKVAENVQAEILDVILCEAVDSDIPVYEVDCGSCGVSETVDSIVDIINGRGDDHIPGKINWSVEMDEWF